MQLPQNADSPSLPQFIGFNQDYACFACGTRNGFRVYNCDPLKERFRREFDHGGIGYVEMLFRCNILALVGDGTDANYPENKVLLWDDFSNKKLVELEFRTPVRAVKLRRDKIVVVLDTRVYVYNFQNLKPLQAIETVENERGLCSLCPDASNAVMAIPGRDDGELHINFFKQRDPVYIKAHENPLSCISLNSDGTRVATASDGANIYVWDTETGDRLQKLRRGTNKVLMLSLSFNYNSSMLCASSDKGTVHVFSLNSNEDTAATTSSSSSAGSSSSSGDHGNMDGMSSSGGDSSGDGGVSSSLGRSRSGKNNSDTPENQKSVFSIFGGYFGSEWSFAKFYMQETCAIAAFGAEKNALIIVTSEGTFYKCLIDFKSSEIKQDTFVNFIDDDDDDGK